MTVYSVCLLNYYKQISIVTITLAISSIIYIHSLYLPKYLLFLLCIATAALFILSILFYIDIYKTLKQFIIFKFNYHTKKILLPNNEPLTYKHYLFFHTKYYTFVKLKNNNKFKTIIIYYTFSTNILNKHSTKISFFINGKQIDPDNIEYIYPHLNIC